MPLPSFLLLPDSPPEWASQVPSTPQQPSNQPPQQGPVLQDMPPSSVKDLPPDTKNEGKAAIVNAYIRSTKGSGDKEGWANTVNTKAYYVIIGCGFASVVNHAALIHDRMERKRAKDLDIIHVGYRDPWAKYREHEMNQEFEVLTHPGFQNQLEPQPVPPVEEMHAGARRRLIPFVRSGAFAKATADELELLVKADREAGKEPVRYAIVRGITFEGGYYWVHTALPGDGGELVRGPVIKADKIDICTGPGQSRIIARAPASGAVPQRHVRFDDALWKEYTQPRSDDDPPYSPRVIAGSEYTRANVVTKEGASVLIQGAGPAAGQGVEEAFRMGAGSVLLAAEALAKAFTPNTRIDFLVTQDGKDPIEHRRGGLKGKLLPRFDGFYVAENYEVEAARVVTKDDVGRYGGVSRKPLEDSDVGRVLVKFRKKAGRAPQGGQQAQPPPSEPPGRFIDKDGDVKKEADKITLVYAVFDQVVLAQGRTDDETDPASGFYLLRQLTKQGIKFSPFKTSYEHNCGLRSDDGRVRMLGAAGLPGALPKVWSKSDKQDLALYETSLPAQCRVFLGGVTLSAVTIAQANEFFRATRPPLENRNVNTATYKDIEKLVTGDEILARSIYRARHFRNRPFHKIEQVVGAVRWDYHNLTGAHKAYTPAWEAQFEIAMGGPAVPDVTEEFRETFATFNDDARLEELADYKKYPEVDSPKTTWKTRIVAELKCTYDLVKYPQVARAASQQ